MLCEKAALTLRPAEPNPMRGRREKERARWRKQMIFARWKNEKHKKAVWLSAYEAIYIWPSDESKRQSDSSGIIEEGSGEKKQNASSPFSHIRPFCLCRESTAAMSHRHVRERRMGWRAHEREREAGEREWVKTWNGENKGHRDSCGNIRCWVRMERGVTGVAAVESVTSLIWLLHTSRLLNNLVTISQSAADDGSSSPARCLFCLLQIQRSLHHRSLSLSSGHRLCTRKQLQQQRTRAKRMEKLRENALSL